MIIHISDSFTAEVINTSTCSKLPKLALDALSLILSPYGDPREYEVSLLKTWGSFDSGGFGGDSFRFKEENMLLDSINLKLPELLPENISDSTAWCHEQTVSGTLRLSNAGEFHLGSANFRWVDPDENTLICTKISKNSKNDERLRIKLAQDFYLLISNNHLVGWMLKSPGQYIANYDDPVNPQKINGQLESNFANALNFVVEPNLERVEDGDSEAAQELNMLYDNAFRNEGSSSQAKVLARWLHEILKEFIENDEN